MQLNKFVTVSFVTVIVCIIFSKVVILNQNREIIEHIFTPNLKEIIEPVYTPNLREQNNQFFNIMKHFFDYFTKKMDQQDQRIKLMEQQNELNLDKQKTSLSTTNYQLYNKIEEVVNKLFFKYNADKTGMADFASESMAASILFNKFTEPYNGKARWYSFFLIPIMRFYNQPRVVIQVNDQFIIEFFIELKVVYLII